MRKAILAIVMIIGMGVLFGASIYPSENFDQNTYHWWTPYNDGILPGEIVGGVTGPHGYYSPTVHSSMGDWVPDPSSGLWYNMMGDPENDEDTTVPFMLTDQAIKSIYMPPDYTSLFTYPYALTNPSNPYYYYKLDQVDFSGGYWGDFWNSPNTSWYVGDVNGGFLITTGTVNLSAPISYLSFSVLKLPGGGGSGYYYLDYSATADKAGPWTNLIDGHQIQHSSGTWVGYTDELPAVTLPNGSHDVYLRIRFRGNVTTGWQNAPFQPQPNYWFDDFHITDDGTPTPVELSSFTGTISAQNYVQLTWITQTETNVSGYRIYRNTEPDLSSATMLNAFVNATNTSQTQVYVWWDEEVYENGVYYYWLESLDYDGSNQYFGPISIAVGNTPQETPPIPLVPGINSLFPNPFNPKLNIQYSLAADGPYCLQVFDLRGRRVATVCEGVQASGNYKAVWDGTDQSGNEMPTGIYYIRLLNGGKIYNRKALLLK